MNLEQSQLAVEVIRCKEIAVAARNPGHPCSQIVNYQLRRTVDFQAPEPWNGSIDARILFISSNPGFDPHEQTVTAQWEDEKALGYFESRLSNFRMQTGQKKRYPPFLSFIKQRASEILQRPANPSEDYCSTELVHCKSRHEADGISTALSHCAGLYLTRLLACSGAKIVVLVGGTVQRYFKDNEPFRLGLDYGDLVTHTVSGREFMFASVYHNNHRGKRALKDVLGPDKLGILRQYYDEHR
jgi:uracil-DNA glycosylase